MFVVDIILHVTKSSPSTKVFFLEKFFKLYTAVLSQAYLSSRASFAGV